MKEEWLLQGATVPVDVETTAELVTEIKRLIDVVGGMALAQPEPVAYYHPRSGFYWAKPTSIFAPTTVDVPPMPLYTSPAPQRTWVGLTDEEETELIRLAHNHAGIRFYIQATETKLKEKNT